MANCRECGRNAGFSNNICGHCLAKNKKTSDTEINEMDTKAREDALKLVYTSTTNSIEGGVSIESNRGVITATIVAGTNVFRDILGSIRDIVGGNSGTYISKIDQIKKDALHNLCGQALENGCNGVIGISIDIDEISGGGKSMFMVTAIGTSVVVVKN